MTGNKIPLNARHYPLTYLDFIPVIPSVPRGYFTIDGKANGELRVKLSIRGAINVFAKDTNRIRRFPGQVYLAIRGIMTNGKPPNRLLNKETQPHK